MEQMIVLSEARIAEVLDLAGRAVAGEEGALDQLAEVPEREYELVMRVNSERRRLEEASAAAAVVKPELPEPRGRGRIAEALGRGA